MGRGCRMGVRARKEGVKRLSQWKLTTWGELRAGWAGRGWRGSLGEFTGRTLVVLGLSQDVQKSR